MVIAGVAAGALMFQYPLTDRDGCNLIERARAIAEELFQYPLTDRDGCNPICVPIPNYANTFQYPLTDRDGCNYFGGLRRIFRRQWVSVSTNGSRRVQPR